MIEAESFDLVLSDVRMPGVSGIELLTIVQRTHPELPVVLMTAFTTEDAIASAIESGVFTVLRKPFDPYRQAVTLRRAVRRPAVLIVDDCQESARAIAGELSRRGVRADAVFGSADAIQAVRTGAVDVCVTGLVMTGMSGLEVSRQLRALDPAISIIFCTGAHKHDELIREAAELGPARYLRKSFDVSELARSIASVRSEVP